MNDLEQAQQRADASAQEFNQQAKTSIDSTIRSVYAKA